MSDFTLWRGSGTGVWTHLPEASRSVPGASAATGGALASQLIKRPGPPAVVNTGKDYL